MPLPGWMTGRSGRGSGFDMILKIVSFFLIGIVVLGMFGKLRLPKVKALDTRRCAKCGSFKIGKSPCVCEKSNS